MISSSHSHLNSLRIRLDFLHILILILFALALLFTLVLRKNNLITRRRGDLLQSLLRLTAIISVQFQQVASINNGYCISLLATDDSKLGPDYASLVPASQPRLNTASRSPLDQTAMQKAGLPRREQTQKPSTEASMADQYTVVSLGRHGDSYTFSLGSKAVAKHKNE
ncbi:hypothetical protein CNMCM7691_007182 [Aspergillus felis]|uniref:Uncharacterized protein n=1 Tax=Aspergillus felis TaxID=1287682 RepID=A0A8H6V4J5_9EURO|nr:hypothetical protein CNMCM7691_007182 [Aspergillus felis]